MTDFLTLLHLQCSTSSAFSIASTENDRASSKKTKARIKSIRTSEGSSPSEFALKFAIYRLHPVRHKLAKRAKHGIHFWILLVGSGQTNRKPSRTSSFGSSMSFSNKRQCRPRIESNKRLERTNISDVGRVAKQGKASFSKGEPEKRADQRRVTTQVNFERALNATSERFMKTLQLVRLGFDLDFDFYLR